MAFTHPLAATIVSRVPGQGTAGTDSTFVIGRAPFAGVLSGATYTTDAAVAGHAANNRDFTIVNKGQSGAGTTAMATVKTTASPDNSFTAFDEKTLTLSGTASNLVVAEGDVLAFLSDANASGVIDPGGLVVVKIERS